MPWVLCDYKGHLAITMGPSPCWDKPELETVYRVSGLPSAEFACYPHAYIGCAIDQWDERTGNIGRIWPEGRSTPVIIDTTGWEYVRVATPIRSPGRRDNWRWASGRWVRC